MYFPYVHVHIVWQTIALLCRGLLVDRFISDPFTVTPPGSPGSPGSASRHKMIRVIACYLPKYHSTWVNPLHNHQQYTYKYQHDMRRCLLSAKLQDIPLLDSEQQQRDWLQALIVWVTKQHHLKLPKSTQYFAWGSHSTLESWHELGLSGSSTHQVIWGEERCSN